jgi:transcriptional regulator with XRE-family HTH domain
MDIFEIGAEIATLRKQRKMTQTELGRITGLSRAFISNLERGVAPDVGIKRVMRILAIFDRELVIRKSTGPPTLEDLEQELIDAERMGKW